MVSLRSAFFFLYLLNVSLNRSTASAVTAGGVDDCILNNAHHLLGCVEGMSDSETSEANSGDSEEEIEDDVGEKEEEEEHIRQGISTTWRGSEKDLAPCVCRAPGHSPGPVAGAEREGRHEKVSSHHLQEHTERTQLHVCLVCVGLTQL